MTQVLQPKCSGQVNSFPLSHGVNVNWKGANLLGQRGGGIEGALGLKDLKKWQLLKAERKSSDDLNTFIEEKRGKVIEVNWKVIHFKTVEYINRSVLKNHGRKENLESLFMKIFL